MSILSDNSLIGAVGNTPPLVSGVPPKDIGRKESRIQPSSIDMTIGGIFQPGTDESKQGSAGKPLTLLSLKSGQTAVVETAEILTLPPDIAAFGFPPSHVSRNGLLMTNPGHVDPGFVGKLKFTVINFGKTPYSLAVGQPICTMLFLTLDRAAAIPYNKLTGGSTATAADSDATLLRQLSSDFMNLDTRMEEIADVQIKKAGLKIEWAKIVVPAITAVAAALIVYVMTYFSSYRAFEERVTKIEASIDMKVVAASLKSLSERVAALAKADTGPTPTDLKTLSDRIDAISKTDTRPNATDLKVLSDRIDAISKPDARPTAADLKALSDRIELLERRGNPRR